MWKGEGIILKGEKKVFKTEIIKEILLIKPAEAHRKTITTAQTAIHLQKKHLPWGFPCGQL